MGYGWTMDYGLWMDKMDYWTMGYVWNMDYGGVWTMDYGLWMMDDERWIMVLQNMDFQFPPNIFLENRNVDRNFKLVNAEIIELPAYDNGNN